MAVAVNYGTFQSQNAAALSTYLRITDNVVLSGGLSYGVEAKQFGGRGGTPGEQIIFAATGVTDGALLDGVKLKDGFVHTHTLVLNSATRTAREVRMKRPV